MDGLQHKPYLVHSGYQKMVIETRKSYFWLGMKKDVVDYIARCQKCQQFKVEYQHPTGFLEPLVVPKLLGPSIDQFCLRIDQFCLRAKHREVGTEHREVDQS
jgi:hypothetical protein